MDEKVKKQLKNPKSVQNALDVLTEKKEEVKTKVNEIKTKEKSKVKVVGITACVTGIAHTYMAEEKMLKAGTTMGISVRIETQGSKGVGSKLTPKEIDEANVVILAADTPIEMERFIGKKVYATKVGETIKDSVSLFNKALKEGKTYESGKGEGFNNEKEKKSASNDTVLGHILAGISYMIPMIVLGVYV